MTKIEGVLVPTDEEIRQAVAVLRRVPDNWITDPEYANFVSVIYTLDSILHYPYREKD